MENHSVAESSHNTEATLTKKPPLRKSKRKLSLAQLRALQGAVGRQHGTEPADSPRVKPTLPALKCLEREP